MHGAPSCWQRLPPHATSLVPPACSPLAIASCSSLPCTFCCIDGAAATSPPAPCCSVFTCTPPAMLPTPAPNPCFPGDSCPSLSSALTCADAPGPASPPSPSPLSVTCCPLSCPVCCFLLGGPASVSSAGASSLGKAAAQRRFLLCAACERAALSCRKFCSGKNLERMSCGTRCCTTTLHPCLDCKSVKGSSNWSLHSRAVSGTASVAGRCPPPPPSPCKGSPVSLAWYPRPFLSLPSPVFFTGWMMP
mmetsp:Transcript_7847/g.19206  ORF Transcript_7847/g.19206 Transcript_7847/m.19206 type:complete len:248 (-) Transcript_7847:181-924(-)